MNDRPLLRVWTRIAFALILCTFAVRAAAIGPDPYDDWRTADSEHFTVHFEQAHRAYAQKVLAIAEKVYGPVTNALDWTPLERTHIALLGNIDLANGYATPLPFNQMGIFLTPPDFTDDLVRGQWLELVLHHEFTHIVHLDKGSGLPKFLRNIFGRAPSATGYLIPTLFPNLFQPRWVVEGLATYSESSPALGIGRLRGPFFEATLRDERQRGFMNLREINADGRRAPLYRNYLYGAYFFDFLTRKYGAGAALKLVESYSDDWIPFRLHSVPYGLTGKMMDELYAEFLTDLTEQVDARAGALLAQPESIGTPVGKPFREIYSVAIGKGADAGYIYAVTDDGLTEPRLQRYDAQGRPETLAHSRYGTRIDVRADGTVLASQLEICDGHDLYYDLYVISPGGWLGPRRITDCGRYFRAVWSADGQHLYALKHTAGTQTLVRLDADGRNEQTILAGKDDVQWLDLAAAPDGKHLALIGKHAASFALYEMDLGSKALNTRHADAEFKHSPHYQGDAIYFLSSADNVFNVWRLSADGNLGRVTHAHTAVTLFGGVGTDGQLALGVLRNGETAIHRGGSSAVMQSTQANTQAPDLSAAAPSPFPELATPVAMQNERDYSALPTLVPRSWTPTLYADRDTFGLGISTFGSDALGIHRYFLAPMYEFTQREPIGAFEYVYHDRHYFSYVRNMTVTDWRDDGDTEKATEYERSNVAQWVSLARLLRWDYSAHAGIGAALSQVDRVVIDGPTRELDDERVAAALVEYDGTHQNIYSEGPSQGLRARLLYETYKPFKSRSTPYDGEIYRLDLNGYLALGKTVLAMRAIEARSRGVTEPFELGGVFSDYYLEAPVLDERRLALRGYDRDLPQLRGGDVRLGSAELRFPIADIDRHFMVPPIGVNRISGTVFYDIGRASGNGFRPKYFQGVGAEVMGEVRLGYLFYLQVRGGVAHGLDDLGETQFYLRVGRSFN